MNTPILPLTINVKKKTVYGLIIFFCLLLLLSISFFWEGSRHLFTENYYCPELLIIGLVGTILLLIQLYRLIKILQLTNGFAKLSDSGIEFFENKYSGIGLVPWNALKGYSEEKKTLCIYAKESEIFINKITDIRTRKKAIKKSIGNRLLFSLNLTLIEYDEITLKKILHKKIEENNIEKNSISIHD
ncbi:hypothetical protein Flavo103_03970 [Flavobacterium collinsii]|uniref:hypothetical protein n=1 Tax=Flavobacterium collinsii TaxID=1114861 RepID=UPI0022C43DDD|nr:hypothetical protein [Flavobacterium collinsii]GIQ57261.1 hypothetical protein Flavo103_03970 [Flavobacterium collinsii]